MNLCIEFRFKKSIQCSVTHASAAGRDLVLPHVQVQRVKLVLEYHARECRACQLRARRTDGPSGAPTRAASR